MKLLMLLLVLITSKRDMIYHILIILRGKRLFLASLNPKRMVGKRIHQLKRGETSLSVAESVAFDIMPRADFDHRRLLLGADRPAFGAPGVKGAAGRDVDGAGNLAP